MLYYFSQDDILTSWKKSEVLLLYVSQRVQNEIEVCISETMTLRSGQIALFNNIFPINIHICLKKHVSEID